MILPITNIIVDIDGTVADLTHRLPFAQSSPKDWDSFFDPDRVQKDAPIQKTISLLVALSRGLSDRSRFWFVSGRPDSLRFVTEQWLYSHIPEIPVHALLMRKTGDHRPDYLVKRGILNNVLSQFKVTPNNTLAVFDDRDQVVKMWREEGFKVYQVADGDF